MKIEAIHEFHDAAFSQGWSDKFEPTAPRVDLFNTILSYIPEGEDLSILELGIGPGYLADYILQRRTQVDYHAVDFAQPMLDIARRRVEASGHSISLFKCDLTADHWYKDLDVKPSIVVSTWALHDLLSKENIAKVYQDVFDLLPSRGIFINGDFIKPEASTIEYEAGRIKPSEHLALFAKAKYQKAQCIKLFEEDLESPTTANNYACFAAYK